MHLTVDQRQTLLAWQRSTTIPAGRARRGRIILLLADRMSVTQIAETADKPGRGSPPVPRQPAVPGGRAGRAQAGTRADRREGSSHTEESEP
jgi:hypothetical protein